jgi:GT2 family glycosyltransferase
VSEVLAVVVAYRSDVVLPRLVSSFGQPGTPSTRIVVVDNARSGSTRTLVHSLAAHSPCELEYVAAPSNIGYAGGVNVGLRSLRSESAVLVINPDARLEPNALQVLLDTLAARSKAGIVAPLLSDETGRAVESYYREPSLVSQVVWLLHLNRLPGLARLARRTLRPSGTLAVDWVSGACMLVRAGALRDIGPLDERYFMYMEDVDWCRTTRLRGYEVLWCPHATVAHIGGFSASQASARAYSQARLAKLIHIRKWRGPARATILGAVLVLESVAKYVLGCTVPGRRDATTGPAQFLRALRTATRLGLVRAQYAAAPADEVAVSTP